MLRITKEAVLQGLNRYVSRFAMKFLVHQRTGGRLNKKDGLTRYGDSHVKDKTS